MLILPPRAGLMNQFEKGFLDPLAVPQIKDLPQGVRDAKHGPRNTEGKSPARDFPQKNARPAALWRRPAYLCMLPGIPL
jgi:hypothetical protein